MRFCHYCAIRGRFDGSRGSLRSFLVGVARNPILKRWREEHRWDPLEEDTFVVPEAAPDAEVAELIGAAVLEEMAAAVVAEVGTVKSRLHRTREPA